MSKLPTSASEVTRKLPAFHSWLLSRGSEIYKPTNPYEITRFHTDNGTAVIYKNKSGQVSSWTNSADQAYLAFLTASPWRANPKVPRISGRDTKKLLARLFDRDGPSCIFCGAELTLETATIEHFVPKVCGGPNHLSNLALACVACNQAVGTMPAAHKVRFALRTHKGEF